MKLLLASGGLSTVERRDAFVGELRGILDGAAGFLFVPYAVADHDAYSALIESRGLTAGLRVQSIHRSRDPVKAVRAAEAILVGGGNTFRLLADLYRRRLLGPIRRRVSQGMPYIGISAGTNVACPTIKTTNDMPITWPPRLDALGLVPFQINPHFISGRIYTEGGDGFVPYAGETREDRLREFHEMNALPVLGLREGAVLRVDGRSAWIGGCAGATLFRRRQDPVSLQPGDRLPTGVTPPKRRRS
ncbi:MAG: dipeptidase PepE [Acidobacteriota bacterium]